MYLIVTWMMKVKSEFPFPSQQGNMSGVYYNYVVTTFHIRTVQVILCQMYLYTRQLTQNITYHCTTNLQLYLIL
jgi:hypothetical protein